MVAIIIIYIISCMVVGAFIYFAKNQEEYPIDWIDILLCFIPILNTVFTIIGIYGIIRHWIKK